MLFLFAICEANLAKKKCHNSAQFKTRWDVFGGRSVELELECAFKFKFRI